MSMIWQSEKPVVRSTEQSSLPSVDGLSLLNNHAHLLVCLLRNNKQTLRNVAEQIGITERAAQRIVAELESLGILERTKVGRRNQYTINTNVRLTNAVENGLTIGDILAPFASQ
ncbi:winged helix-turn-helix domain-containing protein [Kamptonema cortianum]|nr:winged helix-turn-helix domain-containing protein [Geitlerinema splendidum]MDK3161182.1 winged helix-turn-helix domain-containing protein [Kamptonema cortianum]